MYDTVLPRCTLDVASMCAGQIGVGEVLLADNAIKKSRIRTDMT